MRIFNVILVLLWCFQCWSVDETFLTSNLRGQGIIMCMGPMMGHFMGLWASISIIRNELHSKLPIEIWMYDFEWIMLEKAVQEALTSLRSQDVSVHFLKSSEINAKGGVENEEYIRPKGKFVSSDYLHFSVKPRALLASQLAEVILLDSDALLFVKPEDLFQESLYKDTGTLFLNDKPIDWWPHKYPAYDPKWLRDFIESGYKRKTYMRERVPLHAPGVSPPEKTSAVPAEQQSYQPCEGVSGKGGARAMVQHCSQHRQESSVVLFHKQRQQRSAAILNDLTMNEALVLYERIYGDKESFWLACELAGSPYAFSPWAAGHWGAFNATDKTCADKVIEPHFAHYLPSTSSAEPRLLSVNQLKLKAITGGRSVGDKPMQVLGLSPRMTNQAMHDALVPAMDDPAHCPSRIKPFRRVQRCWSRFLVCSIFSSEESALMHKHAVLQKQARAMFNGRGMIQNES